MRKTIAAFLAALFVFALGPIAQANSAFTVSWSDTGKEAGSRTFAQSKYWDSAKKRSKSLPQLIVVIDTSIYSSGILNFEVWDGANWQPDQGADLAKVSAKGPTTIKFDEWLGCGPKNQQFCAGVWTERIVLYDEQGAEVAEERFEINRFVPPPVFSMSLTGKISAKLGTYYSAVLKLKGPKVATLSCLASLRKKSSSLFNNELDSQRFSLAINKSRVIKFPILTYTDVPQYVLVECGEKRSTVTFAVLR